MYVVRLLKYFIKMNIYFTFQVLIIEKNMFLREKQLQREQ